MKIRGARKNNFIYIVRGIIVLVVIAFLISWWNHHTLSSYITEITKADVEELMRDNDTSIEASGQTNNNGCNLDNIRTTVNFQIGVSEDSTFVYNTSLVRKDNTLCDCNNQNENKPHHYDFNNSQDRVNYLLDILSKSNHLVDANNLIFFFTFIVAVLSIFFGYKTVEVDKTKNEVDKAKNDVEQAIEDIKQAQSDAIIDIRREAKDEAKKDKIRTTNLISHFTNYYNVLIRIASIYNMGVMIGNSSMALSPDNSGEENQNISRRVGGLCSRLSLTSDELNTHLNDKEQKLDFLTKDEKEFLNTYLTDTIGELERSLRNAKDVEIEALFNIIENKIDIVNDIKDTLDRIEIQEDIV